ncbi:hypothetical protein M407DRAFT_6049 [Tulasnella calospora MUT 4182]|uniref:Uncharacterized protein n=1 Tax=Tulasnella calospora MUT 4182 TaxID=1051891 RepID=A0A0C3M7E7_9AGAM|nr:hypothetical protein M407DRAFT_6049 [Tulasnella calospora MUT 4182]
MRLRDVRVYRSSREKHNNMADYLLLFQVSGRPNETAAVVLVRNWIRFALGNVKDVGNDEAGKEENDDYKKVWESVDRFLCLWNPKLSLLVTKTQEIRLITPQRPSSWRGGQTPSSGDFEDAFPANALRLSPNDYFINNFSLWSLRLTPLLSLFAGPRPDFFMSPINQPATPPLPRHQHQIIRALSKNFPHSYKRKPRNSTTLSSDIRHNYAQEQIHTASRRPGKRLPNKHETSISDPSYLACQAVEACSCHRLNAFHPPNLSRLTSPLSDMRCFAILSLALVAFAALPIPHLLAVDEIVSASPFLPLAVYAGTEILRRQASTGDSCTNQCDAVQTQVDTCASCKLEGDPSDAQFQQTFLNPVGSLTLTGSVASSLPTATQSLAASPSKPAAATPTSSPTRSSNGASVVAFRTATALVAADYSVG